MLLSHDTNRKFGEADLFSMLLNLLVVSAIAKPQECHSHTPFMHKAQECMLMPKVN